MSENYIVINGKRAELTEEQLRQLGIEVPKANPFEEVEYFEKFYYININGKVNETKEYKEEADRDLHSVANYCTDKAIMEQRALHETLNRLLWRYSMEHKKKRDGKVWVIRHSEGKFVPAWTPESFYLGDIIFDTESIASNAIATIVKPFINAHPDFKW